MQPYSRTAHSPSFDGVYVPLLLRMLRGHYVDHTVWSEQPGAGDDLQELVQQTLVRGRVGLARGEGATVRVVPPDAVEHAILIRHVRRAFPGNSGEHGRRQLRGVYPVPHVNPHGLERVERVAPSRELPHLRFSIEAGDYNHGRSTSNTNTNTSTSAANTKTYATNTTTNAPTNTPSGSRTIAHTARASQPGAELRRVGEVAFPHQQ